ncbi:hypothetical protein [Polynucleobacter kasalickyi]|uniref:Uncharacterized protein n=1 Tax=Polynucleobacter kasalickyi TaxID=1938817 RepID=A0A1W2CDR2_9BURK|nr:hypothetical protein [Polynucleobacter kasalickyi]SMC83002.1 hypothetical protein SAMN06296008_12219 [Polynucleobacter kasalickyi]
MTRHKRMLIPFLLIPLFTFGTDLKDDAILGKYSFQSKNTIGDLKISNKSQKLFAEFSVANRSGCTGEISGQLKLISNNKYLFETNSPDGICKIEIEKLKASLKSTEIDCFNYHGISCDFNMMVRK